MKQKYRSSGTKPTGKKLVFDPAGGLSLRDWFEKHRNTGHDLVVPKEVPMAEFLKAMDETKS